MTRLLSVGRRITPSTVEVAIVLPVVTFTLWSGDVKVLPARVVDTGHR